MFLLTFLIIFGVLLLFLVVIFLVFLLFLGCSICVMICAFFIVLILFNCPYELLYYDFGRYQCLWFCFDCMYWNRLCTVLGCLLLFIFVVCCLLSIVYWLLSIVWCFYLFCYHTMNLCLVFCCYYLFIQYFEFLFVLLFVFCPCLLSLVSYLMCVFLVLLLIILFGWASHYCYERWIWLIEKGMLITNKHGLVVCIFFS